MARYYISDMLGRRVKTSEYLCPRLTDEDEAKRLLRRHMKKVNSEQRAAWVAPTADQLTISQYWENVVLPKAEAKLTHSTIRGYRAMWNCYCKEFFENKPLVSFKTVDARLFLEHLATMKLKRPKQKGDVGLNRNGIALVRAVCGKIFKRAKNDGLIEQNPFSEVELDVKVRKPKKQVMYSLSEVAAVLGAIPRTDAKLLFAFCSLLGLRPGEAAATRWEDIRGDVLHIERSAPNGVLGETKTEQSVGSVLIIAPVMEILEQYRKERGKAVGFLFTTDAGTLIVTTQFCRRYISDYGKAAIGNRWAGLYAGRRAVGMALYNLTGDTRATYQSLRNTMATTAKHYVGPDVEQGRAGQRVLETAFELERKRLKP